MLAGEVLGDDSKWTRTIQRGHGRRFVGQRNRTCDCNHINYDRSYGELLRNNNHV